MADPPAPQPASRVHPPAATPVQGLRADPHQVAAGGLVVVGLMGLLGGLLPWVTLTSPFAGTRSYAGADGWVAVVFGLVIGVCGLARLVGGGTGPALGSIAGVASLALFGVAVWKIADLYASVNEPRTAVAVDPYGLSRALRVCVGSGLWLMAAAGVAGVVLAALTLWHPRLRNRPGPPAG